MRESLPVPAASQSDLDPVLVDLVEEYTRRVEAGEVLAPEAFAAAHPAHAERLRELLAVVRRMADLAQTADGPPGGGRPGDLVGAVLGDYRIVRQVGVGGMGVVYAAVEQALGREVALKILPLAAAGPAKVIERFRREAQAAARLHHTNIVPVFGVGEDRGIHFIAMQFIDGQSLDAVIRDLHLHDVHAAAPTAVGERTRPGSGSHSLSSLSAAGRTPYFRRLAELIAQTAEAVAYAHDHGVLHRDLKPANLLLDADGRLWVTDFGLAHVEGLDELTRPGEVFGTLRYMAPERFDGSIDARSEVYGLGVTLYELATLRPAFGQGERAHLVEAIRTEAPARPRQLDPTVPRDLETVIFKAIDKEPRRRYQTARELADDLRRFAADQPVRARPTRAWEEVARWARRRPAVAALTASLLATAVCLVVLGVWSYGELSAALESQQAAAAAEHTALALEQEQRGKAQRAREAAELAQRAAEFAQGKEAQAREAADKARADAQLAAAQVRAQLHTALFREVQALRLGHPHGWRAAALGHLRYLAATGDFDSAEAWKLRSEGLACQAGHDLELGFRLKAPRPLRPLALSADGKCAAAVAPDGTLFWWEDWRQFAGQQPTGSVALAGEPAPKGKAVPCGIAFVPGRPRVLACATPLGVVFADLAAGGKLTPSAIDGKAAMQILFDRPGKLAVVAWADGRVSGHDPQTGLRLWEVTARARRVALAPGGDRFAVAGPAVGAAQGDVAVYVTGKDKPERTLPGHSAPVEDLTFDATGRLLASASTDGTARVWRVATGRERYLLPDGSGALVAVAFSPDGAAIATATINGEVHLYDALTGTRQVRVWNQVDAGRLVFTPDGQYLLATHITSATAQYGELIAARVTGGGVRRVIPTDLSMPVAAFDPSGKWLAAVSGETVTLWSARGEGLLRQWKAAGMGSSESVVFSPDGSLLAVGSLNGVTLFEPATGEQRVLAAARVAAARSLAFSPDGKRLLVGYGLQHKLDVIDVATGQARTVTPLTAATQVFAVGWLDGELALVASSSRVMVFDIATGKTVYETATLDRGEMGLRGTAVSPDGKLLAQAFQMNLRLGRVQLRKLPTLELVSQADFERADHPHHAAFGPGGRWLAVGGAAAGTMVWDTRKLERVAAFPAPLLYYHRPLFAPDGATLALVSPEPFVLLYDLERLREQTPHPLLAWPAR